MTFLSGLRSRSASDPQVQHSRRRSGSVAAAPPLPALQQQHSPFYRTLSAPLAPPEYPPEGEPELELPPARFPISPREEEGAEPLPPYSSTLLRAAVLSRKLELLSPLEAAPMRSWQTVIVVLNNTQLNVYKAPATVQPVQGLQAFQGLQGFSGLGRVLPWRSSESSSFLSSSAPTSLSDTIDPFGLSLSPTRSSLSSSSSSSSSSLVSSPSTTPASLLGLPESVLDPAHLIRSYTLQYAQIGLATDYKKKQNVIRVRAEGQQFLLLCSDSRETVEWTTAMQAACDLALPLDERTVPRYRSIPSRRRRRVLPSARHQAPKKSTVRQAAETQEAAAVEPPQLHEEDDDEELYYRNRDPVDDEHEIERDEHDEREHDENERDENDETGQDEHDVLADLPAAFISQRPRRDSVPSFMSYDDDEKWAPKLPQTSAGSKLRYAMRCLYTLPANSSWGDKLLMINGDQFIVRERILV